MHHVPAFRQPPLGIVIPTSRYKFPKLSVGYQSIRNREGFQKLAMPRILVVEGKALGICANINQPTVELMPPNCLDRGYGQWICCAVTGVGWIMGKAVEQVGKQ